MKKLILAVCCIVLLSAGCKEDPEFQRKYSGHPMQLSVAPDGTTLWRVYDVSEDKMVYFSSKGTYRTTTEMKGKITVTKEHNVPNAE